MLLSIDYNFHITFAISLVHEFIKISLEITFEIKFKNKILYLVQNLIICHLIAQKISIQNEYVSDKSDNEIFSS